MNTVCLFSTQRPSTDAKFNTIQSNALRSWSVLGCPVVLFGEECKTDCLPHVPHYIFVSETVERNEKGIPYISSMFHNVQEWVDADLYCYVNADIILTEDFITALDEFPLDTGVNFIAAGRRWDVGVTREIPLEEMDNIRGFAEAMRKFSNNSGKLHSPDGIDYFIFPKGMQWPSMPKLVVGHPAWDNWMLWDIRQRGGMLIDMTHDIRVYHQNHDCIYQDDLSVENRRIAGKQLRTLKHATHAYCNGKLRKIGELSREERSKL